jgi:hypothetical protein
MKVCRGPDEARARETMHRLWATAGFDEGHIAQVGDSVEGFFEFYSGQVLPRLREG